MNLYDARNAYENDKTYHSLVNTMVEAILNLRMTPSEIREAAMFASLKAKNITQEPIIVVFDEERHRPDKAGTS